VVHDFAEKLAEGEAGEREQDEFYSRWFNIAEPSEAENRRGIDRKFRAKMCPLGFTVQYKADRRAETTGNLAIEVVSVDTSQVPGWAIVCAADYLSIYIPAPREFYWFTSAGLRLWLPMGLMAYPTREAPNKDYNTVNLIVPKRRFAGPSWPCLYAYGPSGNKQQNLDWFNS
jgi:hypothetical protein